MAKRHSLDRSSWESVFVRLEEVVMANSGADAFEEIFKLVIAKLDGFQLSGIQNFEKRTFEHALQAASRRLDGIFEEASPKSELTDEHLKTCLDILEKVDFSSPDLELFDALFENLVSRTMKGKKGQFFTPRYIAEACIRILRPSSKELIIDPACGSGGFLIQCLRYHEDSDDSAGTFQNLWGLDIDLKAVRIAKSLMLVARQQPNRIVQINSLETGNQLKVEDIVRGSIKRFKGFDVVVTNPPFAGVVTEPEILSSYQISFNSEAVERDVLFLERCVDLLKPGGRMAIVLPHNKLGGKRFAKERKWLLERMQIVAVLGLGRETFLPHTTQKADILFGVKREKVLKNPPEEEILFLTSERSGKNSKGNLLYRSNIGENASLWDRVDHDLNDSISLISEHVKKLGLDWGTE